MKKEIPIYDAIITDKDDGLLCISLVDQPAMEVNMMAFETQNKPLQFAINDTMEHCVTSVVIRADAPIYRYSPEVGEYYIRFSKEIIKQLAEKYSKDGLLNCVSVNHDGQLLEDITMVEFYIKDIEKGLDPKAFKEVEDGSLFCTFKINNEDVWEEVMNGEFGGFSMEVIVDTKLSDEVADVVVPDEEPEDDFWSWLMALLEDDEDVEFISSKKKDEFKAVTKGDIKDAMAANRQVDIELKSGETLHNQQIFQLGEFTEKDIQGHARPVNVAVVYDPASGNWKTYELRNINSVTLLETELVNYTFNPSWEAIAKDGTIGIIETAVGMAVGNSYSDAIETNLMAMIDYYDEENEDGIGFRNCLVTSWGYTTGIDGNPKNETIRVYEYNGVSHSGLTGGTGNWRSMLTRRIKDFKIAKYTEPILQAPDGYNGEAQSGSGKIGTMSNIKRLKSGERAVMQFPPIRKTK